MATYILFWNPDISSYTKENFLYDFNDVEGIWNWSFYEHEKVKYGDTFFLVKCGEGKTGIVMRGMISSRSYHGEDWSPKARKDIYYANTTTSVCINPWSEAPLLTPDILTEAIPDFNWYGGHSGRRLSIKDANKLEDMWAEYLDSIHSCFYNDEAWADNYSRHFISKAQLKKFVRRHGRSCDVCGYSYTGVFGYDNEDALAKDRNVSPCAIPSLSLDRLLYNVCMNCSQMSNDTLAKKLIEKQQNNE